VQQPALPGHPLRAESLRLRAAEPRRWPALTAAAVTVVVLAAMVLLVPRYLLSWDLAGARAPADRAGAVNSVRSTLLQGLAGFAVLVGAFFAWRQLQVSRQGQVTDRYTNAIGQLGHAGLEVRVGGIYALERIARDSAADRLTIAEVLSTFVRVHSPLSPGTGERPRPPDPESKLAAARSTEGQAPMRNRAPHIQAAVTVLGRMPGAGPGQSGVLSRADLSHSDLGHANLAGSDLHYCDLSQALLAGANLCRADLTGTWLVRAVLIRARLHQADLRGGVLWQARLEGADLRATDLTGADLTGAYLDGARLDLADLRGADFSHTDLASATFRGAVANDTTVWPAGFDPRQAGVLPATTAPPARPQSYSGES
jgi:pentapeptide repeat protein